MNRALETLALAERVQDVGILRSLADMLRCDGYHVHGGRDAQGRNDEVDGTPALLQVANAIEERANALEATSQEMKHEDPH